MLAFDLRCVEEAATVMSSGRAKRTSPEAEGLTIMADQDKNFNRDYHEGRGDALNGEVRWAYCDDWTPGYRQGIHDVMTAMAGIN
jgi:hypothetical protein